MIVADLLGWWYMHGWTWCLKQVFLVQSGKISNFFSISDLLKTLFAPFRQDSLQTKNAPIGIKLQVLGGNIISRFLGFFIRIFIVGLGILVLLFNGILGVFLMVLWLILPLIPIIAVVLFLTGAKL